MPLFSVATGFGEEERLVTGEWDVWFHSFVRKQAKEEGPFLWMR